MRVGFRGVLLCCITFWIVGIAVIMVIRAHG